MVAIVFFFLSNSTLHGNPLVDELNNPVADTSSILEYKNKYSEYLFCNVKYVKQLKGNDCGITCLTAVAKTWDAPIKPLENNILGNENGLPFSSGHSGLECSGCCPFYS